VAINKFTKWIVVNPKLAPRPTGYLTSSTRSYTATDSPIVSSQTWAPTSTTINYGSNVRIARSMSGIYVSIAHPQVNGQAVDTNGWYLTPSQSDYMISPIQHPKQQVAQGTTHCTLRALHLANQSYRAIALLTVLRLQRFTTC
jgi:hypothetical protein